MQMNSGRFSGAIQFGMPFRSRGTAWEFFYRDFFTMFLRWRTPILLVDGTASMAGRLMRRRVNGQWQYRALTAQELGYIVAIENGTHC